MKSPICFEWLTWTSRESGVKYADHCTELDCREMKGILDALHKLNNPK